MTDLLIVEPIETEVLQWLQARHTVRHAPELANDVRALRQSLADVRAIVLPAQAAVDADVLAAAPRLRAIGRIEPGLDNIDTEACAQASVELVRGSAATAPAEAEFLIGALISLLRPGSRSGPIGPGRELAAATVGLIGLAPAARSLSAMLSGFGSRLVGYDPAVHASEPLWGRWRIEPMGLRDLLQTADAVCLQLPFYSRYQGLLGERYLPVCKPGLVIVASSHSALFDEASLAAALRTGRVAAVWLDSVEPGLFDVGRPLHDFAGAPNVHVSSRLAGYTQESRTRSVWSVAQRLHQILSETPPTPERSVPMTLHGPVSNPGPLGQRHGDAGDATDAVDTVPSELMDSVTSELESGEAWALLSGLDLDPAQPSSVRPLNPNDPADPARARASR
jgi:D-3-phosphoglycerate dehydrogenase / 2-oxoglutarate reductase